MGTIWGRSSSLEWDANAELAEGALAYFYEAGTSTPKPVYQDGGESTAHEFPLEADGGRWPAVFIPFGSYKVIIKTAAGSTLFSADNIPNPVPFDGTFELDQTTILNTGDMFCALVNGQRDGAVRLNGRSIGSSASSATERANADCSALFVYLWNTLSDSVAAVSTGRGANGAADFAANKRITLPDWRGRIAAGFDDMGNTAASRISGAPVQIGNSTTPGSVLGASSHRLTTVETPAHTHGISITSAAGSAHSHGVSGNTADESAHTHTGTTGTESATHTHSGTTAPNKTGTATGFGTITGTIWNGSPDSAQATGTESATHTHSFTSSAGSAHHHSISLTSDTESAHTHAVTGTSASTGGGDLHNNVQESALVTWFIKL